MKNYIKLYLFVLLASMVGLASCVEDEGFLVGDVLNGDLDQGGFVQFTQDAPTKIKVPGEIPDASVSFEIDDLNGNAASYSLKVYLPDQNMSDAVELMSFTSFPSNIDFTINDLAVALGVDVSTIDFGQQFNFVGSVTTDEGLVYDGSPLEFNIDDGATGGGTSTDLLGQTGPNGYRNALFFALTVDCPSFDPTFANTGVYDILLDQAFGQTGLQIQVLDGPGENELTLVEPFAFGINVVVSFDADGTVRVAKQHAWNHSVYGEASVSGTGVAFSCVDLVRIQLEHTVDAGSFGTFDFTFQLNQ